MNSITQRFTAGTALLLIGLSLILTVNLTTPRTVRATPGVLYAAPAAQGSGDCSSWANACTLQTALAQAQSGDEIWVKAGVHYPTTDPNDRTATFTLKNGVAVYGGFAGTETLRDQRDWQANVTILSGDIDQNDINNDGNYIAETWNDIVGNNAYHVVTGSGTDSSAVLDGFIITAGQANSKPNISGGGMYNSSGSPTLSNVTFSGNWADSEGGGMYNEYSSPTLTNVTFSGNSATKGGGVYNAYSNPTLTNVTFSGNSAAGGGGMYNGYSSNPTLTNVTFSGNSAGWGGGMFNWGCSPTLSNVTFSGNSAIQRGGGMYNGYSNSTLTNVTFSGNSAENGGGMYNEYSGSPTLSNVTFSGNSATNYGGGMYNGYSSSPTLSNVIIWGNIAANGQSIYNDNSTPTIAYSDLQGCGGSGSWNPACGTDGGGNIDADPRFVDAANGNLRLQLTSPAIDAGNNDAVPSGIVTDLDGNPRFVDIPTVPDTGNGTPPIVDMGAYEAQDGTPPTVLSIVRADPNPTNAVSVRFAVTFSEVVQSVDVSDFTLTTTGISGASVTGVSGAGDTYTVTVATGTGSGTLRLDVPATATVTDLAGNPLSGLPYTDGETYEMGPGRVRYAAPTAQGSGDCSSWANACTLQTALAQAQSGDEIWIQAGVHYPTTDPNDRTATFTLKNGVAVYGGFAGTETARDQRDWQANVTILSGDIDQNDVNNDGNYIAETWNDIVGNNAYHVVTGSGTDSSAVLDGFIITAGQANSEPNIYGGGMFNYYSSPTLSNVTFSGNWAASFGGGMYNEHSSSPTLSNVAFSGNSATDSGGGMYNYDNSSPTLTNVTFSGNSATHYGGGMSNEYSSSPTLSNVTFSGNSAFFGGGMYNGYPSSPTLSNVTFSGNSATDSGGGMYNGYSSSPTLSNVTFSGNSATNYGGGMYNGYSSSPTLSNVIIWGNIAANGQSIYNDDSTPTIVYSDLQGCGGSGSWNPACGTDSGGNIDADPRFVDAANGNLRLQLTSPAIDAGNNDAVPAGIVTDLDGNPRFVDIPTVPDTGSGTPPIVDMGAYEAQYVDVALGKAVLPSTVAPGQPIAFTLTLNNAGSLPATGIVLTDTLPAFLGDVSVTSTLVVTDTGHLPPYVWQVQDLAPGQSGVITVSGVLTLPLAAGTYTNTALISAAGDLLAENNAAVITFTVSNVAPVFTGAPVVTATQDAPYTCTATARDDNGDVLTITAPTLPSWLTLVDHGDGTATLSGTPTNAEVGEHPVLLRVADSGGLSDTQAFTITVANVNDAPHFTSTPVLTATQDALYAYAVTTDDPDLIHGDALTITAPTLPSWLTLVDHGDGTATLSGTPSNADVGEHPVLLRVADSGGLTDTQAFTITVANVNDAPFFTSVPVTQAVQGLPYTYAITTADPDLAHGDALTLTAPTLPAWLTLVDHGDGTATLSGTPTNANVGQHPAVLQVADSSGLTAIQAFTITVANVNDPPSFTSTPITQAVQGLLYTYAITATDPDLIHGDSLATTPLTLPSWLTLVDHGNGMATLSGVPSNADVGDHPVVLRVADSGGLSDTQAFTVTVANVNDAPLFTSAPVLTATQDAPYTYTIAATDPDLIYGDALTITAPTLPSWLTLVDHGDGTAILSGTPSNTNVGQHPVVLQVADSGGLTATQAFTITVANVNDPPSFTSTPVTQAVQGLLYTYAITATDPDLAHGDALTITAPTLPSWLTLVDHGDGTATLSGTPSNADVGDHPVVLRVADSGGLSDTQAFTITVANVNDPPFFTSVPVTQAVQGLLYTYAITAADPDLSYGDALTITAPTLPAWLTLTDHGNGTAALSGTPTDAGEYTVVLRVTDRVGALADQEFVIIVTQRRHNIYMPLVLRNWQP